MERFFQDVVKEKRKIKSNWRNTKRNLQSSLVLFAVKHHHCHTAEIKETVTKVKSSMCSIFFLLPWRMYSAVLQCASFYCSNTHCEKKPKHTRANKEKNTLGKINPPSTMKTVYNHRDVKQRRRSRHNVQHIHTHTQRDTDIRTEGVRWEKTNAQSGRQKGERNRKRESKAKENTTHNRNSNL